MRNTFLPFSPPLIGEEEIAEVVDTLRSDWITTGPKVHQFEGEFAAFIGAPAALALNSCTAALHVALAALGIGPSRFDGTQHKDAIITAPMTFCSTVNVIEHVGAYPILVDVEPDTLNINPTLVAEAVHDLSRGGSAAQRWLPRNVQHSNVQRVNVVLPVHLYGHPCDMDPILDIAREHNPSTGSGHRLAVIEDAAHALPAKYKGRLIGQGPDRDNTQYAIPSLSRDAIRNTDHASRLTTRGMQPTTVHGRDDMLDREGLVGHDDALD
jgi:dTDP-4-amino-4,6-dideoxygalactose transaminase